MGLFSGIANVIGIGLQAYSQYKQGQDAKDVYEYNQALAEYQSKYIAEAAELEIEGLSRDVGRFVSRQRAIQGKSGTVSGTGSKAAVIGASIHEGDIDAALIRWRASKDIEMSDKGANLLGTQANQFARSGFINAATTLLGGLSKWDYRRSTLSAPYFSGPPVPAGSGYVPSR